MPLQFSMLIVAANQDLRDRLTRHFMGLGYDVMALHHPRQALSVATFKRFNVAIIDDTLLEMDGLVLMQRLKRLMMGLKVVMMTSSDQREFATSALANGAYDCVMKTCRLQEFARVIEEATESIDDPTVESIAESTASAEDTVASITASRHNRFETVED